jgi:hypothetical protein
MTLDDKMEKHPRPVPAPVEQVALHEHMAQSLTVFKTPARKITVLTTLYRVPSIQKRLVCLVFECGLSKTTPFVQPEAIFDS